MVGEQLTTNKKKETPHPEVRASCSKATYNEKIRNHYDANFKLRVIKEAENTNNSVAARKYNVSECNIRRWRLNKKKMQMSHSTRKAFTGPKKGRQVELEKEVVKFIKEKRDRALPISRECIIMKALEIKRTLGVENFKASHGWVRRMMLRNNLALRRRTSLAQRLPQEFEEKLTNFQKYVIGLRKKHNYMLGQIGNADQTPIYYDMPSNTTVNIKGEKSVLVRSTGNEKMRITVMLTALGDGRKLPPLIVLKRKTMPKVKFPKGIIVKVQEKGWMENNLVLEWLREVWDKRPGALLKQRGMLVLDAFKGHVTDEVKAEIKKLNTDLVVIPGGMTSKLQILDVVVNKPFKDRMRKLYTEWLMKDNHALTPTGKIKKPSAVEICNWVLTAWAGVKEETIRKGFKKCCITNAMDGSEDHLMFEDDP